MTNVINNIVSDKQNIKNQIGSYSNKYPVVKRFSSGLNVRRLFTKQFFLEPNDSFVLGSTSLAILGQSILGDRQTEVGNLVLPYRNIIEENLADVTFIDDNSTASIDINNEEAIFTNGNILLSKVVAKTGVPINSVKWNGLNLTGDNVTLEVSNDNGQTFHEVTFNQSFIFPTSSEDDQVIYRITGQGDSTISAPIKIQLNQ